MTILTVKIDNEKDLPEVKAFLNRSGLTYQIEDDDWANLSETEIEGIKTGLEDIAAGRVYPHEQVMAKIETKIAQFRTDNGR